ncbi:hypothetical protein DID88_006331 [Monilinia fructigena]|uniref:Uncharacterized protein n=1 Tax=Monilinia fructigena TaxID=38457 RepID=A0A395J2C6_9HELO|nr:hypothetical protein DID88_006331 [Monilinia fructigena]
MDAIDRQEYPAMVDRLQPGAAAKKLHDRIKRINKVNTGNCGVGIGALVFDAPWRKILNSIESIADYAQHASAKLSKRGEGSAQKVESAAAKLQSAEQQWHAQAPFIFESLQAVDERRLNLLRDVLTQMRTHEVDAIERGRVAIEQTLTALLEVDTAQEIRNWSEATTRGRPVTDRTARQLSSAGNGGTGSALPIPRLPHGLHIPPRLVMYQSTKALVSQS